VLCPYGKKIDPPFGGVRFAKGKRAKEQRARNPGRKQLENRC
jgi:hypothetical protein